MVIPYPRKGLATWIAIIFGFRAASHPGPSINATWVIFPVGISGLAVTVSLIRTDAFRIESQGKNVAIDADAGTIELLEAGVA